MDTDNDVPNEEPLKDAFPPLNQEQQDLVQSAIRYAQKLCIQTARMVARMWYVNATPNMVQDLFDQLIGAAYAGLCQAAQRYDSSLGTKFITHSHWWIIQGMQKELHTLFLAIGPKSLKSANRQHILLASCSEGPGSWRLNTGNTDHPDEAAGLHDHRTSEKEQIEMVEEEDRAFQRLCRKLAKVLEPRDFKVICQRIVAGVSLREVGKELGISKERVRRLELRALAMLRKNRSICEHRRRRYVNSVSKPGDAGNAVRYIA